MGKAKDEAKIKFTADVEEYNNSIKKANKEMAEHRAELKLNETQMKRNGESTELLGKQQNILSEELALSETKIQALSAKIEKAVEIYGEDSQAVSKYRRELLQARTEEENIRIALDKCNAKLEEQWKAMEEAVNSSKTLSEVVEEQEKELKDLKQAYIDVVTSSGKSSDEAKVLKREIKNLSSELSDNQRELQKASDQADKLDKSFQNSGDGAKKAGDGFSVAKGIVTNLASKAIQFAIDKIGEFTDYLFSLPEATREIRQDFATLETSFETMGFNNEQAKATWKDLYAVFGEDDRAVETANHIAKIAQNQEDLNAWVTIATGVWGSYQDSLPIEGLAEASNETIKTGKVTGVLADALNWSSEAAEMFAGYMGGDVVTAEDAFNKALSECTSEQDRQRLITETLNTLYGKAAEVYREASGEQMQAKEVAAEMVQTEADLATAMEPVTTAYDGLKVELLEEFTPAIETATGFMVDALNWAKEHPGAMQAVAIVFGVVATALTAIAVAAGVYTVAQWAMNTAMWACPLTWIVAAIVAVIAIIAVLIIYWDDIVAAVKNCVDWCVAKWNEFVTWIDVNVIQPVVNFFKNLWKDIKDTFKNVKNWFSEKFTAAKDSVVNAFSGIKEKICKPFTDARDKIKDIANKIKGFFKGEITLPKIKMPHFSIKPAGWKIGDLLQGSIPKLGIEWYAKGGILTRPTIFGMNGNNAMIGGEAGHEAILPIHLLEGYIDNAIQRNVPVMDFSSLEEKIDQLASRPIQMNVNGKNYATAIAGDTDNVNGQRMKLLDRGLVLT